jgi:hypothetical protein
MKGTNQKSRVMLHDNWVVSHFNNIYSYRERKAEEKQKEKTEMTSEEGPKKPKKK